MTDINYLAPRHLPGRITDSIANDWSEEMHSFYGEECGQAPPTPDEIRQGYFDAFCAPNIYFTAPGDEPDYFSKKNGYIDIFIMHDGGPISSLDTADRSTIYDWIIDRREGFKGWPDTDECNGFRAIAEAFTLTPDQHKLPAAVPAGERSSPDTVCDYDDSRFYWPRIKDMPVKLPRHSTYTKRFDATQDWAAVFEGWRFTLKGAGECKVVAQDCYYSAAGVMLFVYVWSADLCRWLAWGAYTPIHLRQLASDFRRELV